MDLLRGMYPAERRRNVTVWAYVNFPGSARLNGLLACRKRFSIVFNPFLASGA
jgi:hypothetical protein